MEQSGYYLTNHILVTMGEDFQYQAAHSWFMNIDKLIRYINSHQEKYNINIFYSTPGVTFIVALKLPFPSFDEAATTEP